MSQDGSTITMMLPNANAGNFQIDGISYSLSYSKNASTTYTAKSGTIVVDYYTNHVMTGAFNASVVNNANPNDVITISDGLFTCKF